MNVFEKAGLVLRDYIKANPDKVKADLERLKNQSAGNDIYKYVEQVSNAYDLRKIKLEPCASFGANYGNDNCETYNMQELTSILNGTYQPPPPVKNKIKPKKGLALLTRSFFLLLLQHGSSR